MRTYLKRGVSLFLCLTLVIALAACSKAAKITEDNIIKTAQMVEKAFKEFDGKTLKKYISSKTLDYIIKYSESKTQIQELGVVMFENLTFEVKSVDTKNKTATLLINNKDMRQVGDRYVKMLTHFYPTPLEMLKGLNDDAFLDKSLRALKAQIARATVPDNPTEVTVTIKQNSGDLMFLLDKAAEDAVSGGALTAITDAFKNPSQATSGAYAATTAKAEQSE